MKKVIYGSPGTGKTSYLIKLIEKELQKRDFDDVAYMTFTKKASEDAKERISNEVGVVSSELSYFGTIHSMCYKLIKNDEMKVIGDNVKYFVDFCGMYNYVYGSSSFSQEELVGGVTNTNYIGNIMLDMYDKARLLYPIDDSKYKTYLVNYMRCYKEDVPFEMFSNFIDNWEVYKYSNDLIDFVDMLEMTLRKGIEFPCAVQFYDEHQDISPLIYEVYKHFTKTAEDVYVSGDPYQSIYGFIGTSPSFFLEEEFHEELVLPNSFRLPRKIWDFARDFIIKRDKCYYDLSSVKSTNEEGTISTYRNFDVSMINGGTTYILARIWRFLVEFRSELINEGIPFKMGKGNIWSSKFVGVNNALYDLYNSDEISHTNVRSLINSLPARVLERGIKARFKKNVYVTKKMKVEDIKEFFNSSFTMYELFNQLNLTYLQHMALENRLGNLSRVDNIDLYLGTIHSVKGLEADNVLLSNEITDTIWEKMLETDMREEARVLFVGMTRAKKNLILLDEPFGRISFPFT